MGFSRQEIWNGLPCLPPGDLANSGIEPRSPALQADSLPSKQPEKPRNTGVGSPSILLGIFRTQESNWGLLHCRQILYQLSYQEVQYLTLSSVQSLSRVRVFATLWTVPHQRGSVHGDSLGKNTGVGCHVLLQGIFTIQLSNPGLPHCWQILYCLSHQGSPRILEWVAYLQGIYPTQE